MAADLPGPVHRPPCICIATDPSVDLACICGDVERCLRGWAAAYPMPPMTPNQRTWCVEEIRRAGDSTQQPGPVELHLADDDTLAKAVLTAWQDYCRDNGLI